MKAKRARGVVGTLPDKEPSGFYADEAKKRQQQKQERLAVARERRANTPIPNYQCYRFLFPNFDPKTGKGAPRPLPKCRVCREAVLHPMEHHTCEGFKPMFVEHDEAWKERMEARREHIRAAKANGEFYDDCEDEPEYDYCEGDEDCEDDGDPMWE
jgi:hypothetical protein